MTRSTGEEAEGNASAVKAQRRRRPACWTWAAGTLGKGKGTDQPVDKQVVRKRARKKGWEKAHTLMPAHLIPPIVVRPTVPQLRPRGDLPLLPGSDRLKPLEAAISGNDGLMPSPSEKVERRGETDATAAGAEVARIRCRRLQLRR